MTAATIETETENATREVGFLFSVEMIRAFIAGRKTQTRRVPTPQLCQLTERGTPRAFWNALDWSQAWEDPGPSPSGNAGPYWKVSKPDDGTTQRVYPRYTVGDRIYAREGLRLGAGHSWYYAADLSPVLVREEDQGRAIAWAHHKETAHCNSIHMPRWAARFVFTITELRAQRVQEISDKDALAEGIDYPAKDSAMEGLGYEPKSRCWWGLSQGHPVTGIGAQCMRGPRAHFASLWDGINHGRGYGWEKNPLVWVYTLEPVVRS